LKVHRSIAPVLFAGFVLAVGIAAPAAAQSPGAVRPDPPPSAVQHQKAPAQPKPQATSSSSSSQSSSSSAPSPAPVSSAPPPAPVQATPTPATSSAPTAPKRTPVKAKKAKAKAKASHVNPVKAKPKAVVHLKRPAVTRPFVPAKHAISLPAEVPGADSGSGMSTRSVLMLAFMVAAGAGLLALLVGAGWRRFGWWRRYHSYPVSQQPARGADNGHAAAQVAAARPAPPTGTTGANGSNGVIVEDGSATIVASRAPTRPSGT